MNPTDPRQGEPGGPIAFMASNRVAANLLMLILLAAGLVALEALERQAWPTVPFNTIEVSVAYPGAAPEEVEESIVVKIEDDLASLPAVSQVETTGTRDYEISIEVPLVHLRAFGLTLDDVAHAVRRRSLDFSAGSIDTRDARVRIRTIGQKYDQPDFEEIVVIARRDGTVVRLGEIADVRDAFRNTDLIWTSSTSGSGRAPIRRRPSSTAPRDVSVP